jgi:3-hydroxyisobutyrate dehydrogenase-like beta-hydroxyacid dehydrogenase
MSDLRPELGFVGTGKMGEPMVERLLAADYSVHVYNRSSQAVERLAEKGAKRAESLPHLVGSAEVVFTALPSVESVDQVYAAMAASAGAGHTFVDHSTVMPACNHRCARLLGEMGAAFLDAPVSGGPPGARQGTLTVMVGGSDADFHKVEPIFGAYGSLVRLCGPLGAGSAVKLVNQLLVGIHTVAAAEAAVLGVELGCELKMLEEILLQSYGGSRMVERNLPRFSSREFSAATPIRLLVKDLGLVADEAKRLGTPQPLGRVAQQLFNEAAARGMATEDIAGVLQLLEGPAARKGAASDG